MPNKPKIENGEHYKVVLFYPRTHAPRFNSKLEADRYLQARALTKSTACYAELWHMQNDEDGIQVATYDYGRTVPQELVRKEDGLS